MKTQRYNNQEYVSRTNLLLIWKSRIRVLLRCCWHNKMGLNTSNKNLHLISAIKLLPPLCSARHVFVSEKSPLHKKIKLATAPVDILWKSNQTYVSATTFNFLKILKSVLTLESRTRFAAKTASKKVTSGGSAQSYTIFQDMFIW